MAPPTAWQMLAMGKTFPTMTCSQRPRRRFQAMYERCRIGSVAIISPSAGTKVSGLRNNGLCIGATAIQLGVEAIRRRGAQARCALEPTVR